MREVNALSIVLDILGTVAIAGIGWLLFRGIHSNGKRANEARNELDRTGEEQRAAQESVTDLAAGIDASAGAGRRIADADRNAQETAQRIADAGTGIAGAVTAAQDAGRESERLADDSEQRIAESESIIRDIRERARKD